MIDAELKEALQYVEPTEALIGGLKTLRNILALERAYARPSLKPEDQLSVHAELGFSLGQVLLLDGILEVLTNPQLNTTEAE